MSTVRHLGGIPHIVRYGRHDLASQTFWMRFWRQGKGFTIEFKGSDIENTEFHKQWLPLMAESSRKDYDSPRRLVIEMVDQWNMLCDCVLAQALHMLQALAPGQEHWITLKDYLHTPNYKLELVKSGNGEVEARVMEGPISKPAYSLEVVPLVSFPNLPDNLPRFDSSDLKVIEREDDWRRPPSIVRAKDGQVYLFERCEGSVIPVNSETGPGAVDNPSLRTIRARLTLHERLSRVDIADGANFGRLVGVVIDSGWENRWDSSDGRQKSVACDPEMELVAGLLLTPTGKSLFDFSLPKNAHERTTLPERSQEWKAQIERVVAQLHAAGIYCGIKKTTDQYMINPSTIRIDSSDAAWLSLTSIQDDATAEEDRIGIKRVFEEWLPAEWSKWVD